jgi:Flp pilus assembly protein TadB
MIDNIFDLCVSLLVWLAGLLGITYKAVNVWIFVIIWPIFTLRLIWIVFRQRRQIKQLEGMPDE